MEQSTELHLFDEKPLVPQEALETVDTKVCKLIHLVEEQQLTITEYKHLPSVTEKRITELLVNIQQLMESLTEVEVRLGHVNY